MFKKIILIFLLFSFLFAGEAKSKSYQMKATVQLSGEKEIIEAESASFKLQVEVPKRGTKAESLNYQTEQAFISITPKRKKETFATNEASYSCKDAKKPGKDILSIDKCIFFDSLKKNIEKFIGTELILKKMINDN